MLKTRQLWRKLLAVTLMAALLAATGCGGKSSKETTADDDSNKTETDGGSAADSGKDDTKTDDKKTDGPMTTITVYRNLFNLGAPDENEVKKVQDEINAYIGDKINVQIDLHEFANSEYKDKANLALGNGEIDLLWTASWIDTIKTDDLVKGNAVADLTSMVQNYDFYKAIPDYVWNSSTYSGKNYFIPVYKDSAEGYDLMFRKDLVDKYGWDLSKVKTLKDIEPMVADCKAEGLKYPYLTQHTEMFFRYYLDKFDFFSQREFLAVDKSKDEVVDTVLTPEYEEFCTLMGDWAEKGYISEDDLTKATPDTATQTQDWGISWWTDIPNNKEADTRYSQEVEMVKITDNWVHSNSSLGSCYAVSSTCSDEEIDACLKFLGILFTDKYVADLYTFGIEGTDYNLVDGKVDTIENRLYDHDMWESAPVTALTLEAGEPDNKIELYDAFNSGAKSSIATGFRFDKSSVDVAFTACVQVFNEYGYTLQHGAYKPADVPGAIQDYQKALDEAGYQKVLAEAQKQYNEWKATRK